MVGNCRSSVMNEYDQVSVRNEIVPKFPEENWKGKTHSTVVQMSNVDGIMLMEQPSGNFLPVHVTSPPPSPIISTRFTPEQERYISRIRRLEMVVFSLAAFTLVLFCLTMIAAVIIYTEKTIVRNQENHKRKTIHLVPNKDDNDSNTYRGAYGGHFRVVYRQDDEDLEEEAACPEPPEPPSCHSYDYDINLAHGTEGSVVTYFCQLRSGIMARYQTATCSSNHAWVVRLIGNVQCVKRCWRNEAGMAAVDYEYVYKEEEQCTHPPFPSNLCHWWSYIGGSVAQSHEVRYYCPTTYDHVLFNYKYVVCDADIQWQEVLLDESHICSDDCDKPFLDNGSKTGDKFEEFGFLMQYVAEQYPLIIKDPSEEVNVTCRRPPTPERRCDYWSYRGEGALQGQITYYYCPVRERLLQLYQTAVCDRRLHWVIHREEETDCKTCKLVNVIV